jgi:hypothetical protein
MEGDEMRVIFTLIIVAISLITAYSILGVIGESTGKLNQAFTVEA